MSKNKNKLRDCNFNLKMISVILYHVPKLCDPVSSDKNPGKIDNVKVYIKNRPIAKSRF